MEPSPSPSASSSSDDQLSADNGEYKMGFGERAAAAAGAALVSAVLVNPLDVAKTRLQAQAAGVLYNPMWPDFRCAPSCSPGGLHGPGPACNPDCLQYKGTLDVFHKITRQEGFGTLWRGTGASLALAIPTVGIYLPSYDILRNYIEGYTNEKYPGLTPYAPLFAGSISRTLACVACSPIELARTRMLAFKEGQHGVKVKGPSMRQTLVNIGNVRLLWTGLGAQLARDVPFSAICWTTLEPIRRNLLGLLDDQNSVASVIGANFTAGFLASVIGANFTAGFLAGVLSAAATCPLDVAKTRRQIEKDPARVVSMNTRQILLEVWRKEGMKGLFRGVGPRVGRAGPSVGIVVSSYEVVKYFIHKRRAISQ